MKVKIDTKEHFHLIVPEESAISAIMAEPWHRLLETYAAMAPFNLVVSLEQVRTMAPECLEALEEQVHRSRSNRHSLAVFLPTVSPLRIPANTYLEKLEPVQTLDEAIDLVAMESLERELLDGSPDFPSQL